MVQSTSPCHTNTITVEPVESSTSTQELSESSSTSKSETESFPRDSTSESSILSCQLADKSSWTDVKKTIEYFFAIILVKNRSQQERPKNLNQESRPTTKSRSYHRKARHPTPQPQTPLRNCVIVYLNLSFTDLYVSWLISMYFLHERMNELFSKEIIWISQ